MHMTVECCQLSVGLITTALTLDQGHGLVNRPLRCVLLDPCDEHLSVAGELRHLSVASQLQLGNLEDGLHRQELVLDEQLKRKMKV